MDRKSQLIIITSLTILLFTGCGSSPKSNDAFISESSTITPVQSTATKTRTTTPILTPSKTPRVKIDLSGYAITYAENSCPLVAVEFYDRYVFQADCAEQVLIPQGSTISITFETPDNQPADIRSVPDLEKLFGALEPSFQFCEFGEADANTITFGTPFQQITGSDILCGFSTSRQGKDVVIVLTGLTTR